MHRASYWTRWLINLICNGKVQVHGQPKYKLGHLLPLVAPEGVLGFSVVSRRNSRVVGSGPEPAVDVDRLEGRGFASLAGKIAFASGSVDGRDVVCII